MKLLIFIPDGVGIKNYLYSNFFDQLLQEKEIELAILSTLKKEDIEALVKSESSRFTVYEFVGYREGPEKLLREAIRHARLSYFAKKTGNPSMMKYGSKNAGGGKGKLLLFLAKQIGALWVLGGYKYILALEKLYQSVLSKLALKPVHDLLTEIAPDAILSTHQRPIENIPVFEVAKRMGIFRTSVIYSWDNVPKSAMYTPSEKYFLWSTFMKEQMNFFYPQIRGAQLVVTGTPQFSFYKNPKFQWTAESFYAHFNIPAEKKIVLFSGSDIATSPYDEELLEDVITVIEKMPVEKRPVLIFRRSPADFSARYDKVLQSYPSIISIDPLWINKGSTWRTAIPTRDDIKNLVGLIQFASLVINVGSTMALDAAIFDKPCIYIAYTPDSTPHYNYGEVIHTEDHFKVMKDMDAVVYMNHKKDMYDVVTGMLENPVAYCPGKGKYLATITDDIISGAGDNMIREIKNGVKSTTRTK